MEFLAPKSYSGSWQEQIARLAQLRPLPPFAEEVMDFISVVSHRVLADPLAKAWPELLAVAHWMRKAHLRELRTAFYADAGLRLARGMVVHYAPSNVDSIFLYSWFISLLAGNSNVVRISRKRSEQLEYLIARLNEGFDLAEFENLRNRNLVVSYEYDDAVSTEICSGCAVRVIWGGDQSVAALRRIALPPLAIELAFADRFSLAVIRAGAVCGSSEQQLQTLAKRFCNDVFSFDQMACSSPRLIVWVGSRNEIAEAKPRFWTEVDGCAKERQISFPAIVTVNRAVAAYAYAAGSQAEALVGSRTASFPLRIHLKTDAQDYRSLHCGGGLLLERDVTALEDLTDSLTRKDQTLAYFGYDVAQLRDWAQRLPARAIDRIVPIGKALEFSPHWDGVDMFTSFTRCIDIQ